MRAAEAVASADRPARVHVKLDTGMGRLGAKDPDAGTRGRRRGRRLRRSGAGRRHDALRHRRRRGVRLLRRAAAPLPSLRRGAEALAPGLHRPRGQQRGRAARAEDAHFDMARCGIAVYGMDPFGEDPAARGLEPALALRSYVADGQAARGRRVGRLRAHLDRACGHDPRGGAADRLRRRLPARPVERGGRADPRPALSGRRHDQHGQHHRRRRRGRGRDRRPGDPDRRRRRRARDRRGAGRASSTRSTTRSRAASRRACRACPWRRERRSPSGSSARSPCAPSSAGVAGSTPGSWAARCAMRCSAIGALDEPDLVVTGDPERVARGLADRAGAFVFPLSERFGAWRVIARDRYVAVRRHAGARHDRGGPRAARLHGQRDGRSAAEPGRLIDPHGGEADLRERAIRAVGPRSFADDPLRTLRMVRFACDLDFEVEPEHARARRGRGSAGSTGSRRSAPSTSCGG